MTKESTYRVEWRIDVDANNPYEAAEFAEQVQAEQVTQHGMAGVFVVIDEEGNETIVDLTLGPEEAT